MPKKKSKKPVEQEPETPALPELPPEPEMAPPDNAITPPPKRHGRKAKYTYDDYPVVDVAKITALISERCKGSSNLMDIMSAQKAVLKELGITEADFVKARRK